MTEILIKKEKFYYTVKLNRPEKLNAFTAEMIKELTEFFKTAGKDKFAKAIVLSGVGTSFCAGADLEYMRSMAEYKLKENKADAGALYEMFESAVACPLPIIGYVHGSVFGGGVGLVAVCDVAVAEVNSKFCFSEVRLGLVPAVISSFVVTKMHGNKAKEYMITGREFDAETAFQSGLVEFAGRELEAKEYLQQVVDSIGRNGSEAIRETKQLVGFVSRATRDEIRAKCVSVIAERRVSDEGQEGIKSFLEKRKPAWAWSHTDEE